MSRIVIEDVDAMQAAIEFARAQDCTDALALGLLRLMQTASIGMTPGGQRHARIWKDFAPYSFNFAIWHGEASRENLVIAGGLIYDGPTAPGDGSFPSLSVNLNRLSGNAPKHSWNIHT